MKEALLKRNSPIAVAVAAAVGIALAVTIAAPQGTLPAGLDSPDQGVVCKLQVGICYDRYGPSIGLTELFLGHIAAERLTTSLRGSRPDDRPGAIFAPVDSVECVRQTGPCRLQRQPDAALTAVLYGPPFRPAGQTAEMRAIAYGEWHWVRTRYGNDTEARPDQPARYTLRFEPAGTLRAKVDCNSAGGQYRFDKNQLFIELAYSTMAACEPGSLDQVFRQNLAAAAVYFMKDGRLFLDLKLDTGTMEFDRPAVASPPGP